MRCKIIISLTLLLLCVQCFAQNFSNKGKEFWVGYGHHQYMEGSCDGNTTAPNDMNMVLYLSAEEAAIVTVTIDSAKVFGVEWKRTYVIPAFTVISTENLPKGSTNAGSSGSDPNFDARLFDNAPPLGSGGENLWRKKGIHITSNVPIVAYAHIYGGVSSGATMLMPVNTWGYSYTSVNSEQRDADRSYSWMYVIAKEDNTRIEIIPSANSRKGKPAGVPFTIDMQKGQIYQLVGESVCTTGNGPELTGTTVKSLVGPDGKCHPVAVFGGSSRTGGETLTCGIGSGRDNDMQQLFPEHAWGKRYATAPFSKSAGSTLQPSSFQTSVYKVVVKDPSTVVKRNGTQLTGLIGGKYYKFSSNTADYIVADKPVMVAQYMSGTSTCNGGSGDPEMITLSPVEQAIKQVGFYRNTKEAIQANYLTLVVPTAGVTSLRIDNSPTFSHTYPHPNLPGYTVVVKGWVAAQSQALVRCDSGFTAITYGLGGAESYGYNAGTFINNLSAVGAIHNTFDTTNTTNSFTCTKTPVELSVLMAYKPLKMEWRLSTLAAVLTPNTDVIVNPPVVIDSPLVNGIKYYKYTLPGNYSFSDTGTFRVPIVVTSPSVDNCTQTDTVYYDIIVKGKPVADFTYTHSGCYTDTIYFSGNGTGGNYTINRWRWEFPATDLDNIRNPKRVLPVGTHNIKLRVISQEGCLGDTIRQITIAPPPATDFSITPGSLCEPSDYSFSSATAAGANVSYYWDFGNGNTNSGTTNTVTTAYTSYGAYSIKHVARQTGQCPSDTVRKTITVFAKPRVNFGYPVGCLPPDGTAQFSDSTIIPDGQTLTYAWDFGDANANAGNPNTSTLQNPTHKYISFGTYTIKLTVTTNNGCSRDTTIFCTFAVRPILVYAPLTSLCANNPVVSVAKASTTNSVPGTGFYRGPGTDSAGNFTPAIAGAGVKTIWYVFTSTGGCKDSISQTIKVHPRPLAVFGVTDSVFCLTGAARITDNSTISGGTITQWKWTFGDGSFANNTNNAPFNHAYAIPNSYTIKLVAISDSSCISDTASKVVKVTPVPVSDFSFLHTGCRLDTVYFTSLVPTNVYSISKWKWQFSNGDTSVLENPKMIFAAGSFTARLTVSTADGCVDDTVKTFTVYNPPVAGFTASPISQCEPGTVNLNDASVYLGTGAITTSYWDYGNSVVVTNSNNNPVTVTYAGYGSYNIKHVVKVSNLCISDTAARVVKVYAKPRVNFGYPVGCLAPDGTAQFSDSTINPDGQILTYAWEFGDPNATTANPNTSNLKNPTHKYIAFGTYTIKLTVTTNNGCSKDTTILCTFAVRPVLAYAPLTSLCANNPVISVATGSVTNGVPGTGFYRGPGTDAAGNFNSAVAGAGVKTIWYIFTSTGGCKDSISQTIRVHPRPVTAFGLTDTSFCLNSSTRITDNSTISGGIISQWKWEFGDGTFANYSNNAPFTKAYTAPGIYTIKLHAISDSSCVSDTAGRVVKVNPLPVSNFNFTHTGCRLDTVYFTSMVPNNVYIVNKWKWQFSNGDTSILENPKMVFAAGSFTARLTVTTTDGCSDDTVRTFNIVNPPVAGFTASPISQCEPGTVNFSDASVYLGSGVIATSYWDYGNGQTVTNNNNNPVSATYPGYGNYTVKHLVKISGLCISDTTRRVVTVYAKPRVKFGYPVGCLPLDNTARFSDSTVIPDGQAVTYSWDFGDAFATAGNPNTSTARNPSHIYINYGTYNIKLTVTTANGCSSDTTITATFAVRPLMAFSPLTSLCVSGGAVSIANATITNGVPGTGFYKGPGTDSAGTFNPAVAGTGVKTIWYVFTSTGGCTDSVSQTIKVHPKPVADFTLSSSNFCLDASTTLTGSSTLSSGTTLAYNWDFGDATTASNPTNAPITKSYAAIGSYTIKLVTVSDSSCVSDTVSKTLVVNPLPVVDFTLPTSICMPAGKAQFTNLSSIPGNISLAYSWNFGDGTAASNAKNPLHIYAASGSYGVRLTVTSPAGCVKDSLKTLSSFFDQPIALFAVMPDTLCQGTPNVFTDLSTAPNSSITNWSWSFGDGSFSTLQTPLKKFNQPGSYDIRLLVTSAQSCVSDTFGKTVRVYLQPVIDAGPSFTVSIGQQVIFKPIANDTTILRFVWTPPTGLSNATILKPSLIAVSDQIYFVTAIGDGNCTATDSLIVKVLKPLKIPNVFSPNGDNINDRWAIPELADYPGAKVSIFDRYGREVYTVTGYAKAWDGTINGKPLPVGVYYYIIDPKNGFQPFTGSVTILK